MGQLGSVIGGYRTVGNHILTAAWNNDAGKHDFGRTFQPMHNAAQVYRKVAKTVGNPREIEADLLLHSASRLQAIQDHWEGKTPDVDEALLYNRKLWTIFLTSVTNSENPLPAEIRRNVANLGLFVIKRTISILIDPRPDKLSSLIGINRDVASGLLSRA
jgi:flagellar biosynthesis activator protein FlaF